MKENCRENNGKSMWNKEEKKRTAEELRKRRIESYNKKSSEEGMKGYVKEHGVDGAKCKRIE